MLSLSQKINLFRGLLSGDTARTGPFHVAIDLTHRCNLQCIVCQYHSPFKKSENHNINDFPFKLFKKLCRELKKMGTRELFWAGSGEPFLHPEFSGMISFAKSEGFKITVFTNGTLFDDNTVQALIDAKLDKVRVSLWASTEEQFQQINPGSDSGMFRKITEGLGLLSRLKAERKSRSPVVCQAIIINRVNLRTIDAVVNLALGTGCEELFFSIPWNPPGVSTSLAFSGEEEQSVKSTLLRMKKGLNALSIKHNINDVILRIESGVRAWEKTSCYAAWYNIIVRSDGTVIPCCRCHHIELGNISESTFREIWNGPAIRAFRKQALSHKGLVQINGQGYCDNCSYFHKNLRVHKYFKWFLPFTRHRVKDPSLS